MTKHTEELVAEIEKLFDDLNDTPPLGRRIVFQNIEQSIDLLKPMIIDDGYALEKCSKFVESCSRLARKRQPIDFDISREVAFALADLSVIKQRCVNEPSI